MNRSRSVLATVALTSLAGLALGATAIRSALTREETYRTGYAATAALVRDRIAAELSPDGARIAYGVSGDPTSSDPRCEIRTLSVDGGEDSVVVPMQRPCAVPQAWSPDGTFIVLTHATTREERIAWDGVTYDAVTTLMQARRR